MEGIGGARGRLDSFTRELKGLGFTKSRPSVPIREIRGFNYDL
jgi:hypothetical protein